ncbi:myocardin related transcription factor Ab isoform X3 [Clarias gariepinus]|uniref:myocardin related transcription factor Ab isoform X3 n=1 Tax=Clarias gariepinus TaxID=13013 RepID=UPI00234D91A1|nr:myocardin related transcription factor Ab isoform X3 [Clarias gariepinus]
MGPPLCMLPKPDPGVRLLDYVSRISKTCKFLQIKLQQRRTREELVSQGIMPPLKSPAAFHEQRRSLERARTEDYLKRKIRSRPERSELVRMHILEETSVEPSLQAKQLKLKRARLADDLNDKISHRPGPIELIHKNILPVPTLLGTGSPKGENSSLDEDSSDGLSPEQPGSQDSPLSSVPQHSPSDMLNLNRNPSPTQFLAQPAPSLLNVSESCSPQNLTNGPAIAACSRPPTGSAKSHSKSSVDRSAQRTKKPKENKPKVKKLKYHQYIPPDQKNDREPPPQLDSSYAKILHQQQLFLQLQIISQQQQHYNYPTILPAPPKLASEPQPQQQQPANAGPSPSRSVPASVAASCQNGANRSSQSVAGGAKPGVLPANLDEFKVAELKHELKLRGLTVSGTKNDLIERLKNYQEQNGGSVLALIGTGPGKTIQVPAQEVTAQSSISVPGTPQSKDPPGNVAAYSVGMRGGFQAAVLPQIARFNSTSSSPPVSPTPSERSVTGMSADEASCNGDVFGEMVSSPLTQLSLHPSAEHPSPVKEEPLGQSACCMTHPTAAPSSFAQSHVLPIAALLPSASLDKDQMLQEKDKQIEQLTRMLKQKQQLVETLRSQLEQGKRGSTIEEMDITVKTEGVTLANREGVKVKEEAKEDMETSAEPQPQPQKKMQTQCSQQTLLKLQQIHRLQLQQQQHMQSELSKQQQHMQSELSKQQQHMQTELAKQQQHVQTELAKQQQQMQTEQSKQQQQLQTEQSKQQQQMQTEQSKQQPPQALQQQKLQQLIIQQSQQKQLQANQKKQQRPQKQQQQKQPLQTQQVSQVFVNQQAGTQITTSFPLDLLKAHPTPTLVTDGNGNHYLIALTNNSVDNRNSESPQNKPNGRITLQRMQSTPVKLPSQSPNKVAHPMSKSQQPQQTAPVKQSTSKVQKAGLHLQTPPVQESSQSLSSPPKLHPFILSEEPQPLKPSSPTSLKGEVCPSFDRHTIFTPPSPKPESHNPHHVKENGSNNHHIDDLFDILIKSGEISAGFKANPDPSLSELHSNPPSPPSSPLHLSPPSPPAEPTPSHQPPDTQHRFYSGSGRLEDFLESTTGSPLLGVDPDGPLTLIDDLHNQMLSTSSILDHPHSPMDTSELSFSPHPTSLDFEDPVLDGMDWLDISMGGGNSTGGTILVPLSSHTPPSVFSADFLDSSDLQLHWDSCL